MRTFDEINADKIAALKRHDFNAAADFHHEGLQAKITVYQCPQCAKKDKEIESLNNRIILLQEQEMKHIYNAK